MYVLFQSEVVIIIIVIIIIKFISALYAKLRGAGGAVQVG